MTSPSFVLPESKLQCQYMFGEYYVYLSCSGKCRDYTPCPVTESNIPTHLSCPGQYSARVSTLANNSYLTFGVRAGRNTYRNDIFMCNDTHLCLEYSRVCDLVRDCDDGSDESLCTNNFQCKSSNKSIPVWHACDGNIDCTDHSDECNKDCGSKMILGNSLLKISSWSVGFCSFSLNLAVLPKSIKAMFTCRTAASFTNTALVSMVSLGDLIVGGYLIILSYYDSFVNGERYCVQQTEWLVSSMCSFLGVLSTVGSQISIFAVTVLSLIRAVGIYRSNDNLAVPGPVNRKSVICSTAFCITILLAALSIALFPIYPEFRDKFVNGVLISEKIRLFVGPENKASFTKVIGGYYGRIHTGSGFVSWKTILEMIDSMFTKELGYEDPTKDKRNLGFYGNDGVCMFKYFVTREDPQRYYVMGVVAMNLFCFFLTAISYCTITIITTRTRAAASTADQGVAAMNRKVTAIVLTDFMCWLPFIVVCILHYTEQMDATSWYSTFSMVIIPINSLINPLLYHDVVHKVSELSITASTRVTHMYNRALTKMLAHNEATEEKTEEGVGDN